MSKAIDDAIKVAGGLSRLAEGVGVTTQAVWKWKRAGEVPLDRVIAIEKFTGVPREQLRPDVFGAPRPRPRSRRPKATVEAAA